MSQPAAKMIVLAAVDLAEGSPYVLSRTFELAARQPEVDVHVLAVLPLVETLPFPSSGQPADETLAEMVARLRELVGAQLDDHALRHPELPMRGRVEVHCAFGTPASEIVWLAAHIDADLILVGTHGRRGLRRLLLGSVAERVCRLAGCPVEVVREKHHVAAWKAPEIEPLCPDCAATRATTGGASLWCARHSVHHLRAHVVCRADHASGPSPTESVTGI